MGREGHGTHEGQQMDKEIEKSFSEVLARGKYVHSIVFHEVKPDKVDEYIELVGDWYPRMAQLDGNKVNLVGSWRTEVGDCNTFGNTTMFPRIVFLLTLEKYTSGSTSDIMDTTLHYIRLPPILNFPSLTRN